jgi:hypothetical protein
MLSDIAQRIVSRGLVLVLPFIVAAPHVFGQDRAPTPVLVELFTSEGCSSCPAADRLLEQLDASQPVAGVRLIVLSEHVDYWDDLGWRDPYSSHALTVRQQNYAWRLHVRGPYTPQMVIDGNYQLVGNNGREANQALDKARAFAKVGVRIARIELSAGEVHARVEVDAAPAKAELFAALALDHAESQVKGGENGGRHLEHVSVLRNLSRLQKIGKGEAFSRDVSLRLPDLSAKASYRLIAFIQEPNQGRVLGSSVERIPQ